MKKIVKYLLVSLFIIFGFSLNVFAEELGLESFNISTSSVNTKYGFENYQKHVASDSSGNSYNAYCVARGYSVPTTAKISRIVGTDKNFLKHDTAILEILKGAEAKDYEIGHIALRIFSNTIDSGKDAMTSIDSSYQKELNQILDCFLTDKEFKDSYEKYKGATVGNKKCEYVSKNEGNNTLGEVKALIKAGLDKATSDPQLAKNNTIEKGSVSDIKKENGKISKIVSVKVSLSGIANESDFFKYKSFSVDNKNLSVTLLGYSKEFKNTKEGWSNLSSGLDLSKIDNEKAYNGDVYIGFLLEMDATDEEKIDDDINCEDVIINTVFESNGKITAAVLTGGQGMQRFYAYIPDSPKPKEITYDLKANLCDEVTCDPTSTLPNICEDATDSDENGNVSYTFREAYSQESGKYNIKRCLLTKNSKDKANNSYKLVDDENASMVSDNPYCEVKCKEDYKFGVPYKKSVEAGRYFQISVSLKGTQDCYTTKLDYKKYSEDVVKKQKEIVDTYNVWLENYENYKQLNWTQSSPMVCSNETCNPSYVKRNGKDVFAGCSSTQSTYNYYYNVIHSNNFKTATITENENNWTISVQNTSKGPTTFGKFKNDKTCSSSGNSCSSSGTCEVILTAQEDWENQKATFESNAQAAKQTLANLIEELRQIVDKYNSCAADHEYSSKQNDKSKTYGNTSYWDMIYNYDPEIIYSYDEPEPGVSSTKWINQVSSLSCEHGKNCDRMYSADALISAEKCLESSNVNCQKSSSVTDIDNQSHVTTWYCDGEVDNEYGTCNGTSSLDYFDEYHWMILDADLETGIEGIVHIGNNLANSHHIVTKVDYVRKTASSEGTYNTERVYYSMHDDGKISIKATPEEKVENADIVDGLPVSINTPTGTYYYKLSFNNLGTYYSEKNTNGRIFGNSSNSLSSIIRSDAVSKDGKMPINKNEYACIYEVNQTTCEDSLGNKHYKTECEKGEDWEKCQKRLCPASPKGPYCVEKALSYYVCNNTTFDSSCQAKSSREEALSAVGCKIGEECEQNYNCCPNCKVECVGQCSITNNGTSTPKYDFRPVSPGNLFPTDRNVGYNWESDPEVYHNSLVARKASDTITEITKRANDVSSEANENNDPSKLEYTLKVTMNAEMIGKIKEYNKEQNSYNNDTMTCSDYELNYSNEDDCKDRGYTWQENKCVMSNVFCTSSFIDDLIDLKYGGSVDMASVENRAINKEKFTTYKSPYDVTNSDNLIVTNDYWTIYRFSTLDVNGDGIPDVGPSWK